LFPSCHNIFLVRGGNDAHACWHQSCIWWPRCSAPARGGGCQAFLGWALPGTSIGWDQARCYFKHHSKCAIVPNAGARPLPAPPAGGVWACITCTLGGLAGVDATLALCKHLDALYHCVLVKWTRTFFGMSVCAPFAPFARVLLLPYPATLANLQAALVPRPQVQLLEHLETVAGKGWVLMIAEYLSVS